MKKEYTAPRIIMIDAEPQMAIAASVQQIQFADDSEDDFQGDFFSKKHYDVWEDNGGEW